MNSTFQNTPDKTGNLFAGRQGDNPLSDSRARLTRDVFTYRFRHIPEYARKRLPCKR